MKDIWNKENLQEVVKNSKTQKECLEKLGIRCSGGNHKTFKKYVELYNIDTKHFITNFHKMVSINKEKKLKLSEILVENSSYNRTRLKERLYNEGLLERKCSLCGQDEYWNEMRISLIIDHINGIHDDNRIENLRIVCPNCNAGLDTFAGRNNKRKKKIYHCNCGKEITKISNKCNSCEKKDRRKVERPEYDTLLKDINELGYSGTGRKYGVSDNAIRKWIKNNINR